MMKFFENFFEKYRHHPHIFESWSRNPSLEFFDEISVSLSFGLGLTFWTIVELGLSFQIWQSAHLLCIGSAHLGISEGYFPEVGEIVDFSMWWSK